MHAPRSTTARATTLLVAAALLAGCSGATSADDPGADGDAATDTAAAETFLEPWLAGTDKNLLVDEPLDAPVAEGTHVVYLDVGTPVSAVMWENLQEPAELLGLELERVETGRDAQSINAAMNSVVELAPDGIINITLDPVFFENQIAQLDEMGIPLVSGSVMNTVEHSLPEAFNGPEWMRANGSALAAAAITRSGGAGEYVFYHVPEFPFSSYELEGVETAMDDLCAECELRVVDIPIAELGSTAADRVVSDLQSNPDTEYFVAAVDEVQIGLPQKLDLAGLDVDGIAMWPAPPNYEQVAAGAQDATLAVDLDLMMWTVLDQLLRELGDQEYSWPEPEVAAQTLTQVVDEGSAPENPVRGYEAIDDFHDRFAANWLVDR